MNPLVRCNLWLTALAMLLGALLWQFDAENLETITSLDPGEIRQIHLERPGQATLELRYSRGQWQLISPLQGAVSAQAAGRLTELARLPSQRRLAMTRTQRLGLDPPEYRLRLDGTEIRIGAYDPYSGLRYLAVGDALHLVGEGFLRRLQVSPEELLH